LAAVGVQASAVGWTPFRPVDSIRSPTALAAVGVEASTVGWSPFSPVDSLYGRFPLMGIDMVERTTIAGNGRWDGDRLRGGKVIV